MDTSLAFVLMGISFIAGGMCGWLVCAYEMNTIVLKMKDDGRAEPSDYDILFKTEGKK